MKMVKSLILGSAAGLARHGRGAGCRSSRQGQSGRIREGLLPVRCRVSITSRARTPASSWVAICASKPRSCRRHLNGSYCRRGRRQQPLTQLLQARSRQDFNIDTRTATEYGVVRTFFDADFTWTTGSYIGNGGGTGLDGLPSTRRRLARAGAPLAASPTRMTAVSPAARSGRTTPSSSSPASRWVRPCRSSMRPGTTIPATTSTISRRRRHGHRRQPVHLYRAVRQGLSRPRRLRTRRVRHKLVCTTSRLCRQRHPGGAYGVNNSAAACS